MDDERTENQNQHGRDQVNLSAAKYLGVTLLNGLITVVEVAGGIMSGSLALLSDAAHNLGDTVSILLSYARLEDRRERKRRPAGPTGTSARRSSPLS